MLDDVAREGHGEVEVKRQAVTVIGFRVQSPYGVDLLVDLTLALEHVHGLDTARLDGREAMEFEYLAHHVEDTEFDQSPFGKPLGEAG